MTALCFATMLQALAYNGRHPPYLLYHEALRHLRSPLPRLSGFTGNAPKLLRVPLALLTRSTKAQARCMYQLFKPLRVPPTLLTLKGCLLGTSRIVSSPCGFHWRISTAPLVVRPLKPSQATGSETFDTSLASFVGFVASSFNRHCKVPPQNTITGRKKRG